MKILFIILCCFSGIIYILSLVRLINKMENIVLEQITFIKFIIKYKIYIQFILFLLELFGICLFGSLYKNF